MDQGSATLLGQGRSCLVYDLGDGTVLRRFRDPAASPAAEAAAMRRAARAGVPVPRVHAVTGADLRMDRIEGPTMADRLAERPEQAEMCGRVLAELHHALDRTGERGEGLIHGDLHPANVLMGTDGPVLIDWTNHRLGPRALDVALTWLVLGCFDPLDDALRVNLALVRADLLRGFLDAVDAPAAARALPEAARLRRADPATTLDEHVRIGRLLSTVPR